MITSKNIPTSTSVFVIIARFVYRSAVTGILSHQNGIICHVKASFVSITNVHKKTEKIRARSTSLLDVFLIALGNVLQVAQEATGWIRLTLTTTSHLLSTEIYYPSPSFWGDATVQADYAMTTTQKTVSQPFYIHVC